MATPIPHNLAEFSLAEIAEATGGTALGASDLVTRGVAIDSRAVSAGSLFVAIRGANHDGARFIQNALAAGAHALLVNRGTACPEDVARVEVADSTRALGDLASHHRRRWGGQVVAVTGSAGKTTTKELAAAAFEGTGIEALKTQGNLNNQFGVPMTVFCLEPRHRIAVLEVGTSGPGEIARLGEIVQPDVAVVVSASAAHTQGLGDVAAVIIEKGSLFRALPEHGVAVVFADQEELAAQVPSGIETRSFGRAEHAQYRLLSSPLTLAGTAVTLALPDGTEQEFNLPLLGEAAALDACAALAAVIALRGPEHVAGALRGMSATAPTPGRMCLQEASAGAWLLDDSYNANPRSTELSLRALREIATNAGGRTLAVLGDMLELGELSHAAHVQVGELAVQLGIDVLVGCGPEMALATSRAARLAAGRLASHPTRVVQVLEPQLAVPIVKNLWRPGDVVLIKGSRSMGMERIVAALSAPKGGES